MDDREADLRRRITSEPGKCGGRPCIRGLRMRVSDVLDLLAHGASVEEIVKDYPYLETADIRACCWYAARQSESVPVKVKGVIITVGQDSVVNTSGHAFFGSQPEDADEPVASVIKRLRADPPSLF